MDNDRRRFLYASTMFGMSAMGVAAVEGRGEEKARDESSEPEAGISAAEDLMREHGVLNRILLIYEEGLRRIRVNEEVAPEVFSKTAALVREFVEDYHEKLEENFIFPEFEKAGKLADLVKTLREQHQAGRRATNVVMRVSAPDQFLKGDAREQLLIACEGFIRMYRPHEAREDTVLFPALHSIIPAKRLLELGEQFEAEEDKLFGGKGFEKTVEQVAVIERHLGIYDLAKFTPK
ncbi:MAG: hemerythrin domain-containing protein [Planctomycetia bacterium]|nr:hemerythrin domain-containing protein [Planctomycetia bacterium]